MNTRQLILKQIKSIVEQDDDASDTFIDDLIDIVLHYRSVQDVANRALPGHHSDPIKGRASDQDDPDAFDTESDEEMASGDEEIDSSDDEMESSDDEMESSDDDHDRGSLSRGLPPHLKVYEDKGRHVIYVATLRLAQGAMSEVQAVVINLPGFSRQFSISGGFIPAIDQYMRIEQSGVSHQEASIMPHSQGSPPFARLTSFNPNHRLCEENQIDIMGKNAANKYILDVEIKKCIFLGSIPTVDGRAIDLAVQQGRHIHGFDLSQSYPDLLTCSTVKKQVNISTTLLKPGPERTVKFYPYLTNVISLDCTYISGLLPRHKNGWRRHAAMQHSNQ